MRIYGISLVLLLILSCANDHDKILPEQRQLTESVYTSVTVQPDSLYQVYAIVAGILDDNLVEEGDVVTIGQPLVQVINSTPKLNAQNAKYTLELAVENLNGSSALLKSIEDEISAAVLRFENDSIDYYRQKKLWEQNIGSKVQYDSKKLNYELSANNLRSAKLRYNRTENELKTAVKQAQNNYEASLITTKDFTIESKIDGKVYALYKEPGEIVTTLEPLASVGADDNFIIEMLVDEVDIVRLNIDQQVLITLDAYDNKVFEGEITKIYPQKDERNQTFKVEAVFKDPPKVLYPGLSGEGNIIVNRKADVLTIPKSYITKDSKVKTDQGYITIETGIENMKYVEVLSGINKDTYIYKLK